MKPLFDTERITPSVWISEIKFNDKTSIELDKNEIVVFVGPNNAGKSVALKNIEFLLTTRDRKMQVITDIKIEKEGNNEDLIQFLRESSHIENLDSGNPTYHGYEYEVYEPNAKKWWGDIAGGLHRLANVFVNRVTTEERLTMVKPPQSIKNSEPPRHPIHFLYRDDSLEERLNWYFNQAFGVDLILNRGAGGEIPLHVGKKPLFQTGEDRVSSTYIQRLEQLDRLDTQGDGMRSFVGVLLSTLFLKRSIHLIDEPEAFLHPPQARLLGRMIAKELPKNIQLFLATHSEDFLKGLIDANITNLKIIRIQRNENINNVSVLDNSEIKNLYKDSFLRHSNILNGLFHSKVVICEGDSDCQFYSAVLSEGVDTEFVSKDIFFTHCNGKARIPTAIRTLKMLNVPLKVIADFDVLNNEDKLKEIYEGLGGIWNDIAKEWNVVNSSIIKKKSELKTAELKKEVIRIFEDITEKDMPKEKSQQILDLFKKPSGWSGVKKLGKASIPSGDATQAFEKMQKKLQESGLLIPDVGELECFVKSIANHSSDWVNEVLKKDLKNDPELESARRFVAHISA